MARLESGVLDMKAGTWPRAPSESPSSLAMMAMARNVRHGSIILPYIDLDNTDFGGGKKLLRGKNAATKNLNKKNAGAVQASGFRIQASGFRDGLILHPFEREGPSLLLRLRLRLRLQIGVGFNVFFC